MHTYVLYLVLAFKFVFPFQKLNSKEISQLFVFQCIELCMIETFEIFKVDKNNHLDNLPY
jgi:hypothetical protein